MKEIRTIEKSRSLGESVDILRESVSGLAYDVTELYELDEDNYQMIRNLQTALDKANNRINALQRMVRNHRFNAFLGFAIAGVVIWTLIYACANDIERLENQIEELKNPEKHEESDG